ncbi:MAG: hypothetical protein ACFFFB_11605 [Candidatus Heimdallarchaeota archaeon]
MSEIRGILFSILEGQGTRSEGPTYFIKPLDDYKNRWSEILVRKKTHMWERDPNLHKFLNKEVSIIGDIIETKNTITVDYVKIKALK